MRARDAMVFVSTAAVLLVSGCVSPIGDAPRLQTIDTAGMACAGVGLEDGILHGNPTDHRIAWIELRGFGERQAVFPTGFTARFNPSLNVLDATGAIVFREGDKIEEACVVNDTGALLIGWP